MDDRKDLDVLDSLLDSINNDDTMEKKINDFARTKQRRKRIEKARETSAEFKNQYSTQAREKARQEILNTASRTPEASEPAVLKTGEFIYGARTSQPQEQTEGESENPENTVVVSRNLPDSGMESSPNEGTMVFDKSLRTGPAGPEPEVAEPEEDNRTVYMDENEIKSLLEEDEPLLKREYVGSGEGVPQNAPERVRRPKSQPARAQMAPAPEPDLYEPPAKPFSWKWPMLIFGAVLCALLLFGVVQLANNYMTGNESEKAAERQKIYDELAAWADTYNPDDETDAKSILDYEKMFNRLDDEQKEKLNELLEQKFGKTFDELLAAAKSADKTDTSSNMTQIAEQKASLRMQINDLQNQLNSRQNDLNNINGEIQKAYNDWQNALGSYNSAQTDYNNAVAAYNSLTAERDRLAAAAGQLTADISSLNSQIAELQNGNDPDKETKIADLQTQLSAKQTELNDNQSSQNDLNSQISEASGNVNYFKGISDSAEQAMNTSKQNYDAIAGSGDPIQNEIDSLQNQINDLQNQLNSL